MLANKLEEIQNLFSLPLIKLIEDAHDVNKKNNNKNIQKSALLSIKTGSCPEDCAYCPQSGHHKTDLKKEKLCSVDLVKQEAIKAKTAGATRFCLGAAWKFPPKKDFPKVIEMVKAVKELGMEACVTLGTLTEDNAQELKKAGLDYYNHNLDTSPEYYEKIISTRTYKDRLTTLSNVTKANLKVCCGGIIGMGESRKDRVNFLFQLAILPKIPDSIPINMLIAAKGTPLENQEQIDELEFIRTIAVARILFPNSTLRLSAGRENMSASMQTLCFYVGAGSVFVGDKLLTTNNQKITADEQMFEELYG